MDLATLNRLIEAMELDRKTRDVKMDAITDSINALAVNIGQLAQMQKETTKSIQELKEIVREQTQAVNGHLAVAQAQAQNIADLTRLAHSLISRN